MVGCKPGIPGLGPSALVLGSSMSPAARTGPGPDAEQAVLSASCFCCCPTPTWMRANPPEPRVVTGFVQLCAGGAIVLVLLGATRGLGSVGKGCVGWARSQGGAAKRSWQVECCLCLRLRHLRAEKTVQKQRRPHRRDKASISSWGHPQLPETPLSLRTVGRLSEALVGTAICLSFDGLYLLCSLPFVSPE